MNYALAPSGLDEKTEEDGIKAGRQAGRQEGDQEKIVGIRHGLGRTFLGGSVRDVYTLINVNAMPSLNWRSARYINTCVYLVCIYCM